MKKYLIWDKNEFIFNWKFNDFLYSFGIENSSSWITRVDNDNSFNCFTFLSGWLNTSLQFFKIELPSFLFAQIIWAHMSTIKTDGCRVKWILWDWDHDWIVWWGDQSFQNEMNSLRSTFSKEDIIDWWSLYVIFSADIISNSSSDWGDTQGMSVASSTDDLIEIFLSSFWSIRIDSRVSNQIGIDNTWEDFSIESEWLLFELLRVTNVTKCDLIEWIFYESLLIVLLPVPFCSSFCISVANVGTTPRTAYWASITFGLISVQKNPFFFVLKFEKAFEIILAFTL